MLSYGYGRAHAVRRVPLAPPRDRRGRVGVVIAEVGLTRGTTEHTRLVSVPDDAVAALLGCIECCGTGWWDFAPYATPGGPCVDCKGTGRVWVGLC